MIQRFLTTNGSRAHRLGREVSRGEIEWRMQFGNGGWALCGAHVRVGSPAGDKDTLCKSCERIAAKRTEEE